MRKYFIPDFMFDGFCDINPDFLKQNNIRALLCDIDNTLSPYEETKPGEAVCNWVNLMRENGIALALISNNNPQRVTLYNETLGLPAFPDAHKPSGKCYLAAIERMGVDKNECAVLGDQIFTDVWAANRLKIRSLIVPPIRDKKTLFFRFKRALEVPFIRAYRRNVRGAKGNNI